MYIIERNKGHDAIKMAASKVNIKWRFKMAANMNMN